MRNKYIVLIGFLVVVACSYFFYERNKESDNKLFVEHASQLLDNIYRFYYSSSCPCGQELFYETYPPTNEVITYKTNGETLEHEKMAYFWHMSSMFSGVNALLECTGSSRYIHLLENSILPMMECYYDTIRTPHAFQTYPTVFGRADRYYDDNIWIGMEFLKLYELTDNKEYLGKAESIWTFVESGIDNVLDGGVYWCEQKKFSKNTCSNAPAVVLALKLYKVTKKEEYLEKGKQLYRWVKSRLQDSNDGLCYDKVLLDGQVEQTKYTYNSGQMLQAASLFYQLTGKEEYLQEARKIAEGCRARFFDVTGDGSESVRMLKNGNVWFIAVMLRGFLELYHIDGNPTYINDYKTTLKWLWENGRDGKGLFEDNCLAGPAYYGKKDKYLLTQGALVEMYARLSAIN